MNERRGYSMAVRGPRAAATRERILATARELFDSRSTDFTLEGVAAAAGVSVQTVLRAFGNKEHLVIAAIGTVRDTVPEPDERPRSIHDAVERLVDDYEEIGDRVILVLAEEHRIVAFAAVAAEGRERHRQWVSAVFADELSAHRGAPRDETMAALLVPTDVYTWKLLRRDLGLDRDATAAVIERLVRGVLDRGRT